MQGEFLWEWQLWGRNLSPIPPLHAIVTLRAVNLVAEGRFGEMASLQDNRVVGVSLDEVRQRLRAGGPISLTSFIFPHSSHPPLSASPRSLSTVCADR